MTVGLSVILMNVALFLFTADFRSVKVPYGEWPGAWAASPFCSHAFSRSSGRFCSPGYSRCF